MTKPTISLQELRAKIGQRAKSAPAHRFWGLQVHIMKPETLEAAYLEAKRNGGAPGSDDETFEAIEAQGRGEFLAKLAEELRTDVYHPKPSQGGWQGPRDLDSCDSRPRGARRPPAYCGTNFRGRLLGQFVWVSNQIEFVNMIVNHLTEHGVMDAALLYESPFTDLSPRGPDGLFTSVQVDELVGVLQTVRAAAMAG